MNRQLTIQLNLIELKGIQLNGIELDFVESLKKGLSPLPLPLSTLLFHHPSVEYSASLFDNRDRKL